MLWACPPLDGADCAAPRSAAPSALRWAASLAVGAASVLLGAPASAQDEPDAVEEAFRGARKGESAQYAAFELRFGPYSPKVDDSASTPIYSEFFGDKSRFMIGFELDWQAWRIPHVGTIGIGGGLGYTQMSGTNLPREGEATDNIAQSSTLDILPLYAVGVLRIDTFARHFSVPLVPYGKFGFGAAYWWVNDGRGTATNDQGLKGKDVSTGIQAAVGAMFLLDILEPSAARTADVDTGVNNSYVFFEWAISDYGGEQMNVGSSNWVTGLAFEM